MIQQELIDFMTEQGVMPMMYMVADEDFQHPTENWFYGPYAKFLREYFDFLGTTAYTLEANDCDDFARKAADCAQTLHCRTPNRRPKTALAIGEFWYERDSGGGHAINCAVVYENDEYRLIFLEPQNQQRVALSKREVESCSAFRF
jgi:hypothetical protein